MKKIIINSIICILTTTLAVSCAPTVNVTTDYDRSANFAAYKTYSVYDFAPSLGVNELNARRILNSVKSEMNKKGYTENDSNPDLKINVVSALKDRKYISATGNGWGPYGYWGGGNATLTPNYYKEGSLIVHAVDVKTNRLLWEGIGNAELTQQPKNPDEAISQAVTKIMTAFPQRSSN